MTKRVRSQRAVAAAVMAACALLMSSCTLLLLPEQDEPPAVPEVAWTPAPGSPESVDTPRERRAMAQAILDRRARAVRDHDLEAFVVDLAREDPEFVAEQKRLFDNLVQLPLGTYTLRAGRQEWGHLFADEQWEETAYLPYIDERLQLDGFDRVPVRTTYGITFAPVDGHWAIVSTTDVAERTPDGTQEAPWDLTPIRVVQDEGVLGIFDKGAGDVETTMAAAANSIELVSEALPVRWRERVVVYALGDRAVLDRISGIPGGDVDGLSALAFPVYDGTRGRIASTRALVHPDYVDWIQPSHDVLLTHELTHVATSGVHGGGPTWANEGLAEWVATDGASPDYWSPGEDVVARAREGASELPNTFTFNTVDVNWHYKLALSACDYIAEEQGEDVLWQTYLALQRNDYQRTDAQQDAVLEIADRDGLDASSLLPPPTTSPTPRHNRRAERPTVLRRGPMKLHEFPRHPLTFGPSPVHRLAPADRAPRRCRGLGQARGRQQRPGVRRQQGPQAGVHRPRRARQRRGHAGLDRRHPVQPHPAGGCGRGPPRAEGAARPGEVGAVGRPGQRQGRQHPALADDGRRRPAGPVRVRHRHPAVVGGRAPRGRGGGRHAVPHPGRRERAPARRAGLRQLGLRGRRAGAGARRALRHDRRLHGHGLDARRDDRRVRRARGADRRTTPRARHRRLGHPGQDDRAGGPDRPAHRRADRARAGPARRRDPGARGLGR